MTNETTYIIQCYEDPFQMEPSVELRRNNRERAMYVARQMANAMFEVDVWKETKQGTAIACFVSSSEGVIQF